MWWRGGRMRWRKDEVGGGGGEEKIGRGEDEG